MDPANTRDSFVRRSSTVQCGRLLIESFRFGPRGDLAPQRLNGHSRSTFIHKMRRTSSARAKALRLARPRLCVHPRIEFTESRSKMSRRGMPKRRYYYDRKGNLKGSSSDTYLASPKAWKGIFIALFAMIAWQLMFGKPEPTVSKRDGGELGEVQRDPADENGAAALLESERAAVQSSPIVTPESEREKPENPAAKPGVLPEDQQTLIEAPENDRPIRYTRSRSTEAYMRRTYVDGNSSCPRDIVTYQQQQCGAGDEQACQSLDNTCRASIENENASLSATR